MCSKPTLAWQNSILIILLDLLEDAWLCMSEFRGTVKTFITFVIIASHVNARPVSSVG